jgi:hypothetical protein
VTAAFLKMAAGHRPPPPVAQKMAFLEGQTLSHRLFEGMYRLIAERHHRTSAKATAPSYGPTTVVDMP